jgi:DNA-binding GntR family transcriptional regulator
MCGRLAGRRLQAQDEAALREALNACKEAADIGDSELYFHANERFHRAVYYSSGNRFLAEQAVALYKRLSPVRRMQFRVRNRLRSSCDEHEAIVTAIVGGDSTLASQRLHSHISIHGERFGDLMATLDRARNEVE